MPLSPVSEVDGFTGRGVDCGKRTQWSRSPVARKHSVGRGLRIKQRAVGQTKRGGFRRQSDVHFISPHERRRRVEQYVEVGSGGRVRREGEVVDDGVVGSRRDTKRMGRGAGLRWRPRWMWGGCLPVRERGTDAWMR
jgi:hypothetical protein